MGVNTGVRWAVGEQPDQPDWPHVPDPSSWAEHGLGRQASGELDSEGSRHFNLNPSCVMLGKLLDFSVSPFP